MDLLVLIDVLNSKFKCLLAATHENLAFDVGELAGRNAVSMTVLLRERSLC
jgi:hypothetical protein